MTVPMYPVYSPGQPQAPQGFMPAQVPGYAPAPMYPTPGFAPQVPQYLTQQAPQAPMQYAPQMPPVAAGTDLNQRLYGGQFPQELQGKTLGEALRYYGIMREDFVRRTQQQQQQPLQGQPGQQQPWQPPQPQGGQTQPRQGFQSAQPQFGGQPGQGQQDPMRQMIQEAVSEAFAPVVAQTQQQQMEQAYRSIAQRYPDFQHFAGEVMQSMQGAPPQMLVDPRAWEATYFHAKGKRTTFPQQPGQGQGFQPTPMGQPQVQGFQQQQPWQQGQQVQFGPQGMMMPQQTNYPMVPQQGGFIEGPTPAAPQGGFGGGSGAADPRDEVFARRFGMSVEAYRMAKQNPDAAAQYALRARQPQGQVQYQQGPPMPGQQQQVPGYPPQQFVPQQAMNGQGGQYGY